MGSSFVAQALPDCCRLFAGNIALGHAMKSEGTNDIEMLEDERPDFLGQHHAVGVGCEHDWFFRGEVTSESLELAEKGDHLRTIAFLGRLAFVGDQAAVCLLGNVPSVERRMMAVTMP